MINQKKDTEALIHNLENILRHAIKNIHREEFDFNHVLEGGAKKGSGAKKSSGVRKMHLNIFVPY